LLKGGSKKSRTFPAGSVGWRKVASKLKVVDEAAALDWARADGNPSLIRVKVELNRAALGEHFKSTGEVPPGCEVEPEGETCYVKVAPVELQIGEVTEFKALP